MNIEKYPEHYLEEQRRAVKSLPSPSLPKLLPLLMLAQQLGQRLTRMGRGRAVGAGFELSHLEQA